MPHIMAATAYMMINSMGIVPASLEKRWKSDMFLNSAADKPPRRATLSRALKETKTSLGKWARDPS